MLSEMLASFQALHPEVTYQLYSGNADHTKERIEGGTLDLGLLLEPVDISKYDFIRMPVKEQWGVLIHQDDPLARKESVTPEDLAGIPLILTRRELIQQEMERWFGPCAQQLHITATGNLPYNMALLAGARMGAFLTIRLHCTYDNLRFVPLSPPLESSTVLAWKKAETFSPAVAGLINHVKNCLDTIAGHSK